MRENCLNLEFSVSSEFWARIWPFWESPLWHPTPGSLLFFSHLWLLQLLEGPHIHAHNEACLSTLWPRRLSNPCQSSALGYPGSVYTNVASPWEGRPREEIPAVTGSGWGLFKLAVLMSSIPRAWSVSGDDVRGGCWWAFHLAPTRGMQLKESLVGHFLSVASSKVGVPFTWV